MAGIAGCAATPLARRFVAIHAEKSRIVRCRPAPPGLAFVLHRDAAQRHSELTAIRVCGLRRPRVVTSAASDQSEVETCVT